MEDPNIEDFIKAVKKFAYEAHRRMDKIENDQEEILIKLNKLNEK